MTDLICSVCYRTGYVTMVQATAICKDCLEKAKEQHKQGLEDAIKSLVKDGDIYE